MSVGSLQVHYPERRAGDEARRPRRTSVERVARPTAVRNARGGCAHPGCRARPAHHRGELRVGGHAERHRELADAKSVSRRHAW